MRNDDDRIVFLQLDGQLFDLIGGNRVQRRGRLIHQDDFRFHSDRAGDAQTLLLTARKTISAVLETILDLIPQRSALQ